ncbi:Cilia- and flagella-associated protein 20 [Anthophora quadrimaculata]
MVDGYVSLLYSISDKPLEYWSKQHSQSGRIRKILDSDLLENVIEIQDFEQPHGYGTSIICPPDSSQFLNIELPILVIVIKNLNLQCRIQVQVVDTKNCLHHFQFTNAENERQSSKGVICRVKVKLETGWNKLELNLSNLLQTAFKSDYAVTQRLQICGNCRLRRIYFIDKHYDDEEVCPKLYQRFLDSYMLKWGIHKVERSTQTNSKRNKSKVKGSDTLRSTKQFSDENLSKNNSPKNAAAQKIFDENFLKNLQLKTNILVNEFFDRQSIKLPRTLELKHNTRLKPYAFPMVAPKQKLYNSTFNSEEALKKIGILRTFTESYICNEEKRKENNAVKAVQENWRHRYLLPKDELSNNADSLKQTAKRTMLERKPKSLLLLSEMKPNSAKETTKKNVEVAKRNESDTVIK